MTRVFAIIASLFFIQVAFAADPNQGVTTLQPTTAGDATSGVTVLSTNGQAPTGACAVGSAGCQSAAAAAAAASANSNAPIAAPPPGMHNALVIHPKADCGCQKEELNCACAKQEFVEPELKPIPRNCSCSEDVQDCSCRRHHNHHESSESGESSQIETVAPEQSPNHVVPEVRNKLYHPPAPALCNGTACPKKPEFVQPELTPDCSCAAQQEASECACAHLKPNF